MKVKFLCFSIRLLVLNLSKKCGRGDALEYVYRNFLTSHLYAAADKTPDRSGNEGLDTLETIPDAVPVVLTEPPIEDQLAWHTLWPESHKLYGHGNELFSLCCDHKGKLVASSCKVKSNSSFIFHIFRK